jgi:hypothetical protein
MLDGLQTYGIMSRVTNVHGDSITSPVRRLDTTNRTSAVVLDVQPWL